MGFSVIAAFGGGFGPAAQALALELYNSRAKMLGEVEEDGTAEAGNLFGAMSVVQAMGCVVPPLG